MEKTSLYMITGFLGSGKTTMLNRFIRQFPNKKIAVLMNEFGGFNVDSKIIDDVPMSELLNGCICCDLKADVEVQLHDLHHRYHPDIIIIEATGIAHPVEIYDACVAPSLTSLFKTPVIITLVDGPRYLKRNELSATSRQLMEEQVKYGHILLLNKQDLMTIKEQEQLAEAVHEKNTTAIQHLTTFAEFPSELLNIEGTKINGSTTHRHGIQSMVYTFNGAVDSRQFVEWLRNLPDSILRVKGFIKFRENKEQTILFQYAYGIPQYDPEIMNMPLKLVIIGESLNKEQLLDQLDQLQFN